MDERLFRRRAHARRSRRGTLHIVGPTWVRGRVPGMKKARLRRCPRCGARILTVAMPNGGLAHFEGALGLGRVKHPCLHQGEGLSRRPDEDTPDLFDLDDAAPTKSRLSEG